MKVIYEGVFKSPWEMYIVKQLCVSLKKKKQLFFCTKINLRSLNSNFPEPCEAPLTITPTLQMRKSAFAGEGFTVWLELMPHSDLQDFLCEVWFAQAAIQVLETVLLLISWVLKALSVRARCWQVWLHLTPLSLACRWPPARVSSHSLHSTLLLCGCLLCVLISPHKDASQIGLRAHHWNCLLLTQSLFKKSSLQIQSYFHILNRWL